MIEHIVIIALFTLGYCCTFWEGMIFEAIGDYMECNLPEWMWKPLGGCYVCACMWIGSGIYIILWWKDIVDWFVTCVAAMGVNAFVSFVSREGEDKQQKHDKGD